MTPTYTYKATVMRVIDGDTAELVVDLGFFVSHRIMVRLAGINAPEMRDERGPAAKAALSALLPVGSFCLVTTRKAPGDKYGRWLAKVQNDLGIDVNGALVADGHAVEVKA